MKLAVGALAPPKHYAFFAGPTEPQELLSFLAKKLPELEQGKLQWLIEFGAVYKNQSRILDAGSAVNPSDTVRVHFDPRRYDVDFEDLQRRIIFQNADFIIINKPSGLPMHPTLDNLNENLISGLKQKAYVTHRLDVPTSGLVLVAKTPEYQTLFNKLVSQRELKKTYLARTMKPIEPNLYRHYMKETVRAPKEVARELPKCSAELKDKWSECLLRVLDCQRLKSGGFEVKIQLLTGRTHQIRAQLSFEGAPLIGDEMYGGIIHDQFGLHASELVFTCPKTGSAYQYKVSCEWGDLPSEDSAISLK
jgi:23S rRNA pseudouridine1911/1915/1917 synthase